MSGVRAGSVLLAFALLASASRPALARERAFATGEGLRGLIASVEQAVDDVFLRARPEPPHAVKLRWRPRRVWSGVLEGSLLDLAVASLGGSGPDSLIALTQSRLVMFSQRRGLVEARVQIALPGALAASRSRDAIGIVEVYERGGTGVDAGAVIRARSSEYAKGTVFSWRDSRFVPVSEFVGYPLCQADQISAAPGRNYFVGSSVSWVASPGPELGDALSLVGCSRGLRSDSGHALRYISEVSTSGHLRVLCRDFGGDCSPFQPPLLDSGFAHLVTDLNHDGALEVVTTGLQPSGVADVVRVFTRSNSQMLLLYERKFERGIVAMEAGDFDGDGVLELVVAERSERDGGVTLWFLN